MHIKIQDYLKVAHFLSEVLDSSYHVTLKDMEHPHEPIFSSQAPPAEESVDLLAFKLIHTKAYLQKDAITNYQVPNHYPLRTSTLFIKDEANQLLGMLSIHCDNSGYHHLAKTLLDLHQPHNHPLEMEQANATSMQTNANLIQEIITQSLQAKGIDTESISPQMRIKSLLQLSFDEKIAIMQAMQEQGIFLIKGSVGQVAQALHCSTPSVYRYLHKIKTVSNL
ncbi:helix-turn-helix domain-containing protein [Entomospira culicis]|uniref:Uncharacterized protein n=1 Tax=Entomospira culicis TaxID=2719989 RepID=A0A968KV27_9SPIO|nr:helix-turn-helix domain-containing protein [Entomospira culicis]NIZ19961.1 hypothetical protein [Entomospira culicis]NIZ70174.1 hypothetical protein [Entomospira culicis]WDI38007.1 helix-turn-helix domain-containing protein [Entomospira culicis]WDI39630.1 helix-turn-helix domain-containing protein [Entomospira culicis]